MNSRMVNAKLLLKQLSDVVEGVAWVARHDEVGSEHDLAVREGPHVEVMDLFHEGKLKGKRLVR